ncbi:flagellar assembly peptidoglycan hydrolase FlgJ [Shewanella algae]|uniref:flagellar assembly peptidoglycan hydrolase FlgJ n=1 Tax=Shewanella algae TaxID=38313 RepID=UPI001AAE6C51|nr:flagellar assembly peptidoglycan hydrolase FlgJ [Shewanella algae]MBO2661795.1 flagellar assembly peptidoglycan hydrolase FlgJ [Shewanella algae]MCL1052975.1 flagellar assembly peptidoglycan hydrolase FlgJ [Shewanella algae]
MNKMADASQFLDLGGLDKLRAQAQQDQKAALKEVAQQFEGIFVQMLMKSMRDANAIFESDSPMNSQYTKFYEQMHDQQMSVELSSKGMLGLADLMVQQLSPENSGITPASVLRGDVDNRSVAALSGGQAEKISGVEATAAKASALPSSDSLQQVLSGKVLPSWRQARPAIGSQEEFVRQLYPHAKAAAEALGTQPEVLLAQSALETGWGQKMVRGHKGESSNNLFNIKADRRWQGEKAAVSTLEYEQGTAVRQKADFRVYDSFEQSFNDFVRFISDNDRYSQARKMAANPDEFIKALAEAGYATDPQYANKVMKVLDTIKADFGQLLQEFGSKPGQ